MEDELFIMFYIAAPIVLLAAAFVYYMYRRREDIEKVSRSNTMPREEGETRPGQHQRNRETSLHDSRGPDSTGHDSTRHDSTRRDTGTPGTSGHSQPT